MVSRSNAWRGILETMELTTQGMGVGIRDGRHIEFWNHRWLDGQRLIEHAFHPIPEELRSSRVLDFWNSDTGWEWAQFSHCLPTDILKRIASFDLGSEEIADKPRWLASKTGSFTIQSAINTLQASVPTHGVQWGWIWKLRLSYRIQVFLWLLFHRKLLTNAERFRRSFSSDSLCGICFEDKEDLDHLLRKCLNAQDVWHALHNIGLRCIAEGTTFKEWLQ